MGPCDAWCISVSLGIWLGVSGHSIKVEFERRSLVKSLCETGGKRVDVNILQSISLVSVISTMGVISGI